MSVFSTQPINNSYVKVRWQEPYTSASLNNKFFGIIPPGFYSGFSVGPGGLGGRDILVGNTYVQNGSFNSGLNSGYVSGAFDASVGFSIAVYQDPNGFQETIEIPTTAPAMHLDATGLDGQTVYIVLGVTYIINAQTTVSLELVNASEINSKPYLLVAGACTVPANPLTPLNSGNFNYFDTTYPRTLPFANGFKSGYQQAPARILRVTSNTVLVPTNQTIEVNCNANSLQVTLPLRGLVQGQAFYVDRVDGNPNFSATILTQGGDTFEDGTTSFSMDVGYQAMNFFAGSVTYKVR